MSVANANERPKDCIQIKCNAKATKNGDGPPKLTFQGYSGDAVDLSDYGFDYPVVYNISSITYEQKIPILYNHFEAVGHTTSIRKVDNASALRGKGLASLPGESTNRIVAGIENGFPWQASMGLRIPDWKNNIKLLQGKVTVNNREFKPPIYVVENAVMNEMTVCEFGRDSNTSFEFLNQEKRMIIKNAQGSEVPPKEPTVDPAPAPTPAPVKVENSEPTPTPVAPPAPAPTVPVVHNSGPSLDENLLRAMRLMNKHPKHFDVIEKGIRQGWDDEAIENSITLKDMNNNLPTPPGPGNRDLGALHNQLQARMSLSFGIKPEFLETKLGKQVVEQAHDMPQMGIVEMLLHVANAQGGNFTGHSDVEKMCKFVKNSGYSTFDLPEFFEKTATFIKEERWTLNPPFAPTVCKEGSNKDFRTVQKKRVQGGDIWDEVSKDGKLGLFSAQGLKEYQTKLQTYGSLFTFTREEVINDDMDVLTDLMNMMVEGAMILPDYQLGQMMLEQAAAANTFWVDDDNSFDNTPLTRTNLSARYNAIRQYTEQKERVNWNVMMDEKWRLIVSPNLEETAWELIKQDKIVQETGAASPSKTGEKNYWFGKFELMMFNQMANTSAFPNGSKFVGNTTWMLWPTSARFAPYEITYLRGQKKPITEAVDLPATMLGFGVRGYWDVKINERERTAVTRCTATA